MLRTYYLITNSSGCTYWSYIGDKFNTVGWLLEAVEKHGEIYVNRNGGWMPKACAVTIHKTVTQRDFPPEA